MRVIRQIRELTKEAEEFLKLGGSGCWEGNLEEMRETRNEAQIIFK
ncbi:MAG: hypothetical protein ACM3SY_17145 [Candidatus Omnitrophota bacterium]